MQEINLFEHNEEGYNQLIKKTKESNFAFLERATGTGKSYILLKYMATRMQNKRILLVTMHDTMANQFFNKDMPALGIDKNSFKTVDYILYASLPKHSADWYTNNYDAIFFDEAHHCGANKWGEIVEDIRDQIKASTDKKMIGVTATATRYLDSYTNVCEKYFENQMCSQLGIVESMMRKLLPVPYYININKTSQNLIGTIERKLNRIPKDEITKELKEKTNQYKEELEKEESIPILLKKHGVKPGEKYIFFCSGIEEISNKIEEAKAWFKDIGEIETYKMHSLQRKEKNAKELNEFEKDNKNTIKLMFSVDMFNEGLHIKNVDGLFLARKTTSPIIYLQQIGRALSFSARKDQIKIFDIVGNATNIKIVYEIYKELIAKSKEQEVLGNNIDYYKDIINKFRIIDAGSKQIDQLTEIQSFIDENYIQKDKIEKAILSLKAYTKIINGNFMDMLRKNEIEKEQKENYRILKSNEKILKLEHFIELNKMGITISDYQLDPKEFEKIEKYGSIKNAEIQELKQFLNSYNMYCSKYSKRPDNSEEIAKEYRKKLIKYIKSSMLKNHLKNANYPLNLEELIILGNYPPQGMINEYIHKINEKYKAGTQLDELEIIIFRRLKNRQLIENQNIEIKVPNNIVLKISKSIIVIEKYLQEYPGQTFNNIKDFDYDKDLFNALKCIYRDCEYVTNHQFKRLLELGIKLPKKIDMTIEERQKLLGKFESIAEMNKVLKITETKKICNFINDLKRRPSSTINEEKQLAATYKKIFTGKNYAGMKKIIQALTDNEIELNLEEKMKCKFGFTREELANIKNEIINHLYFNNNDTFNYEKIKSQIVVLYYNEYIDNKQKNIYRKTAQIIETCLKSDDNNKVKFELTKNISLIPYNILEYIEKKFNIKINIKKDNYINIAEKLYTKEKEKFDKYYEYIKENKKRPERDTKLARDYINFLVGCTQADKMYHINKLNFMRIPITKEELYILKQITNKDLIELYKELEDYKNQGKEFDYIQEEIYRKTKQKIAEGRQEWIKTTKDETVKSIDYIERESNKDFISSANEALKNKLVEALKSKIEENPNVTIDYSKILVTETDRKELEAYRLVLLAKINIKKLIAKMEKEQKSYYELLNSKNLEKLEKYKNILKRNQNMLLVNKLEELNKKLSQNYNMIDKEKFISEYLNFIKENKRIPQAENSELEYNLVKNYNIITKIISPEENKTFLNAIKKELSETKRSDFYEKFINFINENERFPNKIGDSKEEIELAQEYQLKGSRLKPEQRKVITELQRKYQKNTIEYVQRKRGK